MRFSNFILFKNISFFLSSNLSIIPDILLVFFKFSSAFSLTSLNGKKALQP